MLLYVDKKKQRKRKIKIISCTLFCLFVIFANIFHLKTALQTTSKHLTTYQTRTSPNSWYNVADVVTIFIAKNKTIKAIIIPTTINRENSSTISLAFSKLPQDTTLTFTPEVPEQDFIQKLADTFIHATQDNPPQVIITTNLENIADFIKQHSLRPQTLNFQHSKKLNNNLQLITIINNKFPLTPAPTEPIKQEQLAIGNFLNKYTPIIRSLFKENTQTPFTAEYYLLQNISVCLSTANNQFFCSRDKNKPLTQNLKQALAQVPQNDTAKKLILLTSEHEIPLNSTLENDDGLIFYYKNREQLLLPAQRKNILTDNIYKDIKTKAGLNHDYHTPEMKFYKFKTMEIEINDNI